MSVVTSTLAAPQTNKPEEAQLLGAILQQVSLAVSLNSNAISIVRQENDYFYDGLPLLRLRPSQNGPRIILNDTQSSVDRVVSSVCKAFYEERSVEACPLDEEDIEPAKQATKMVRHAIFSLNNGKMLLHDTVKATAKYPLGGVLRIVREKKERFSQYELYLPDVKSLEEAEQAARLIAVQNTKEDYILWKLLKVREEKYTAPLVVEDTPIVRASGKQEMEVRYRYCAKFEIKKELIEHNIIQVPPEEFLLNKDATGVERASFVAQRRLMPKSDIAEMWPEVNEWLLGDSTFPVFSQSYSTNYSNEKQWRRRVHNVLNITSQPANQDPTMRQSLVLEGFIRYDYDGDGYAEWRHFAAIDNVLIENTIWEGPIPFILPSLCKDPYRPDEVTIVERSKDATLTKTALARADIKAHIERSSTQIIAKMNAFPYTGQRKLLSGDPGVIPYGNTELGSPQSQQLLGPIGENVMVLQKPDPTPATSTMLQYMDIQRGNQIGINGINDPSLTKDRTPNPATNAALQQRNTDIQMEDYICVFGETLVKPLFSKMWWFITQDATHPCIAARFLKLTGKPCLDVERANVGEMDWRDEWVVNVGLGVDSPDYKAFKSQALLQLLMGFNQAMMQTLPNLMPKVYYAFQESVKALGYDADTYFMAKDEFDNYMQALIQAKQQEQQNPPPPDPLVVGQVQFLMAQAQEASAKAQKTQAEMTKVMAEVEKLRAEADARNAEVPLKLAQAEKERREASVVEMVARASTEKKAQVST